MKELLRDLTGGNVAAAKVILSTVVMALATYQVFLMAVGYGRLRLPFLGAGPAARAHRAVGDSIVVLAAVVALMCVVNFGGYSAVGDAGPSQRGRVAVHVVAATSVLALLALKVMVVRAWRRWDRFLPLIGLSLFVAFALVWATSALDYLRR